jgi:hypothetical protein
LTTPLSPDSRASEVHGKNYIPATDTDYSSCRGRKKDNQFKMSDSLLDRKYFDGIYIPAGLMVFGTLIVKREWTVYAFVLALALGSLKYFNNRMLRHQSVTNPRGQKRKKHNHD